MNKGGNTKDIYIYEDQTGRMIYPVINSHIDENIKKFFNIGTDIFIEKQRDILTIYCHIIARKGSDRYQGYYIKYLNNYNDYFFNNFYTDLNKTLGDLGLVLSPSDIINTIFSNIKKFDSGGFCRENIDIIKDLLSSVNRLEYHGGDLDKISSFCKSLLEKIDSITISVSSEDSKLGNINIIRKTYKENLRRSENTTLMFEGYKIREDSKKKDNEEKEGNRVIIEGATLIRRGISTVENIGRNPKEIIRREMGSIIDKYAMINVATDDIEEKAEKKTNILMLTITIFIIALMIGILIGILIYHRYPDNIKNLIDTLYNKYVNIENMST